MTGVRARSMCRRRLRVAPVLPARCCASGLRVEPMDI